MPSGGGGMEWQSSSRAQPKRSSSSLDLPCDRLVIGAVRQLEALLELLAVDRPAPKMAVLLRSSGNDAEPAAGAGRQRTQAGAVDHRRVDLVLGAVAIDRGTRGLAMTAPQPRWTARHMSRSTRGSSSDARAGAPAGGHRDQPVGIVPAGMRHGE